MVGNPLGLYLLKNNFSIFLYKVKLWYYVSRQKIIGNNLLFTIYNYNTSTVDFQNQIIKNCFKKINLYRNDYICFHLGLSYKFNSK